MAYQVLTTDEGKVIIDTDSGAQVQVNEKNKITIAENSAYCLVTRYQIKGSFLPEKVFVFRALNPADLESVKKIADFFFLILLDTDLYVKEVPQDSTLFIQEAARWYGINEEEVNHGAISVIWDSGAK